MWQVLINSINCMRALYSRIDQLMMTISFANGSQMVPNNGQMPPGAQMPGAQMPGAQMPGAQMRLPQPVMGPSGMGPNGMGGPPTLNMVAQPPPQMVSQPGAMVPQLQPNPQQPMLDQQQQMAAQMAPPQQMAPGGGMPPQAGMPQMPHPSQQGGHMAGSSPMQAALAAVQQTQPAIRGVCVPPPALPLPVLGFASADGGCGPRGGPPHNLSAANAAAAAAAAAVASTPQGMQPPPGQLPMPPQLQPPGQPGLDSWGYGCR